MFLKMNNFFFKSKFLRKKNFWQKIAILTLNSDLGFNFQTFTCSIGSSTCNYLVVIIPHCYFIETNCVRTINHFCVTVNDRCIFQGQWFKVTSASQGQIFPFLHIDCICIISGSNNFQDWLGCKIYRYISYHTIHSKNCLKEITLNKYLEKQILVYNI